MLWTVEMQNNETNGNNNKHTHTHERTTNNWS